MKLPKMMTVTLTPNNDRITAAYEGWHIIDPIPVDPEIEAFHIFANDGAELGDRGICLNPQCSRPFHPARVHQVYCCERCRQFGDQEMRKIGLKAAPALLAHRLGKYAKKGDPLRGLGTVGRNYVSALQAAWFRDRKDRRAASVWQGALDLRAPVRCCCKDGVTP